jgi:hypothetical protein
MRIVVQNDTQQGIVNHDLAVVIDQTQFTEFVHELAYARSGRADDSRERLLADLANDRFRHASLVEICQQKKCARQAPLARIEQLIYQVLLDPERAGQKVIDEKPGKYWLFMEHADHGRFLQPHSLAIRESDCRGQAPRLPGEASFAKELVWAVDCDDGLFALFGYDSEFDLAPQDVENHIRRTALREHGFTRSIFDDGVTAAVRIEKNFRIEATLSAGPGPTINGSLDHMSEFPRTGSFFNDCHGAGSLPAQSRLGAANTY